MGLWGKILIAVCLGIAVGLSFGEHAAVIKPVGDIYLNLLGMILIPLVLSSIVIGVTNFRDPKGLGRIGAKAVGMFLLTSFLAVLLGIGAAKLFKPGLGLAFKLPAETELSSSTSSLGRVIMELIPPNPVTALVEGNVLQIIVFATFLGMAIRISGERGKPLVEMFESLADVMYKLTSMVMEYAPIGVFALMASISGTLGWAAIYPLLGFLCLYYAACVVYVVVVFCTILCCGAKIRPWPFFKGMADAIMLAFSTCSSSATLPVAMHCVQKNLGVSRSVASFVMPLGAAMNMNGAAIFQGMASIVAAQAYGIDLGLGALIALVCTALFSPIGAAGVPGAGVVMLSYVFSASGLPLAGLALFVGIDRMRDMVSTVLNVLGGGVCSVLIARQEGELDECVYYHERLVELEGDEV